MGCCTAQNKSNTSRYQGTSENDQVGQINQQIFDQNVPFQKQASGSQAQPDAVIPNPNVPTSPNKDLGPSTLEEILANMETIYTNTDSKIKVVKGRYDKKGASDLVAAKIMTMDTVQQMSEKLNELKFIYKLEHLLRVVTVYDVKTIPSHTGAGFDIIMIQEFAPKSLSQEIRLRSLQNPPILWSEDQLISFVSNCVEVLAEAQEKGIAHRDIKPANILLFTNADFKFCDFGVAKQATEKSTWQTITGTPPYLSYLLYQSLQKNGTINETTINWFKQDVVSLAIMLINMARLSEKETLNDINNAKLKQEDVMKSLDYSEKFKSLLRLMLDVNEKARPDFIKLRTILKTYSFEQVLIGVDNTEVKRAMNHAVTAPDLRSALQDLPPTMELNKNTISPGQNARPTTNLPPTLPPTLAVDQNTVSGGINPGQAIRNLAASQLSSIPEDQLSAAGAIDNQQENLLKSLKRKLEERDEEIAKLKIQEGKNEEVKAPVIRQQSFSSKNQFEINADLHDYFDFSNDNRTAKIKKGQEAGNSAVTVKKFVFLKSSDEVMEVKFQFSGTGYFGICWDKIAKGHPGDTNSRGWTWNTDGDILYKQQNPMFCDLGLGGSLVGRTIHMIYYPKLKQLEIKCVSGGKVYTKKCRQWPQEIFFVFVLTAGKGESVSILAD